MRTGKIVRILILLALSLALASFLGGCNGRSNDTDAGNDGKDGNNGGDQNPGGLTICDIQNAASPKHPAAKAAVSISGVIVTSPMIFTSSSSKVVDGFWVQDPAGCGADGAKWSGTFVYAKTITVTVNPGDKVDIAGVYDVSYGLNEIVATTVTTTGTGSIPAPALVTPTQVKTGGLDAAAYQNVLVEVDNTTVANPAVLGTDGKAHGDFSVKAVGGNDELIISYKFKSAPAPNGWIYTAAANDTFAKIVGVLDYSFNDNRVQPRKCDDLMKTSSSSACPTCQTPAPTVTITQIQNPAATGHVPEGCSFKIVDVVVTTPLISKKHFYVEDATGGEWSGVYVYNKNSVATTGVAQGQKVTIEGSVSLYYGLTEIVPTTITVNGAGSVPTPEAVAVTDIMTGGAKQQNYEGVLVQVSSVQVTDKVYPGSDGNDHGDFEVAPQSDLTKKLVVSTQFDYAYSCPPTITDGGSTPCTTDKRHVGDNFSSMTGVMDFSYNDARLQPRGDADLVP